MDRYITHQVSAVHTNAIVKAAKLDRDSRAARPSPSSATSGRHPSRSPSSRSRRRSSKGDRVLLMGVGSGLNTAMMEIAW